MAGKECCGEDEHQTSGAGILICYLLVSLVSEMENRSFCHSITFDSVE